MLKSPHLQYLKIYDLIGTTPANRSLLLEFAAQAALRSSCLNTLHIEATNTSAEVGDKFLQALADHTIHSLQHLTISFEIAWFASDRDGCMAPLLVLLARQLSLKSLTMEYNELKNEEKIKEFENVQGDLIFECFQDEVQ